MSLSRTKCLQVARSSAIELLRCYNKMAKEIEKYAVDIYSNNGTARWAGMEEYGEAMIPKIKRCRKFYELLQEYNEHLERFDHREILSNLKYYQYYIQYGVDYRNRTIRSQTETFHVRPIRDKIAQAIRTIRKSYKNEKKISKDIKKIGYPRIRTREMDLG